MVNIIGWFSITHSEFLVLSLLNLTEVKKKMGLSQFPITAEGVLPVLVMKSVFSVVLLKNMVRSLLQVVAGATAGDSSDFGEEDSSLDYDGYPTIIAENARERRISITQFRYLLNNRSSTISRASSGGGSYGGGSGWNLMECCVCLCRFEADQEVSELSCKHFFHKGCLDKWFDNKHFTCPLCRSIE